MKYCFIVITIFFIGCQEDLPVQPSAIENYLMALETSMIDGDRVEQIKWIETLKNGFEKDSTLAPSQKNDLILKLDRIKKQGYNLNSFEILHHLKQLYLFSSDLSDPYTIALWRYGQDLNRTYKTIKDPKLDLYEWNEFMDQVQCAIESWSFLESEFNELQKEGEFVNDQFLSFHSALKESFTNFSQEVHARAEVDNQMLNMADNCLMAYRNLVAYRSNLIEVGTIDDLSF
jgi:hypothetical protein